MLEDLKTPIHRARKSKFGHAERIAGKLTSTVEKTVAWEYLSAFKDPKSSDNK